MLVMRVKNYPGLTSQIKNDIIWELKQVAKKECRVDAKAD